MPMVRSATRPTDPVYDSWGNIIREDWVPVAGQPGVWGISGETYQPGEAALSPGDPALLSGYTGGQGLIQQAQADPLFASGVRSYAVGAPGAQSVNAYNNALLAQGIQPSELPYGQVGQDATARVLAQHGQPLPGYISSYLSSNPQAAQKFRAEVDQTNYQDLYKAILKQLGVG